MSITDSRKRDAFSVHMAGAEHGIALEQYWVGMSYYFGNGVDANKIFAYKWFIISESNHIWDHPDSKKVCKDTGDNLMKDATPEDLAEGQKLANAWIKENRKTNP